MSNRYEGKVALVTGGSAGIGLATAQRLAAEGARVYITGRRQVELDAAVTQIGPTATGIQGDVANLADLDRLYEGIRREAGRLDVLFANAGYAEWSALEEATEAHFDGQFGTNVRGLFFSVQKALPLMSEGSAIVLNGSVVSITGLEGASVYSATKAAVRSFARTWTSDLKARGIRVNVVSPGPIHTPGMDNFAPTPEARDAFLLGMAAQVPLGRIGGAEEIAAAVAFLASDEARFIAGVELFVDGGLGQV